MRIKKVICEQLALEKSEITPETSFTADLGTDYLDIVELVMAIEEEFGVEIPDKEAEKICAVKDAVKYVINNNIS